MSNMESDQEGHKHSTATAALDGGSIALHTTSVLRLSRHLGSMAFSSFACIEILDGTQGLPASICRFKTNARRDGGYDSFLQLQFC